MVAPSTKRLGSYLKIRIKKGPGCNMQKKGGFNAKTQKVQHSAI